METEKFFGTIEDYYSEFKFKIPYFDREVEVLLGEEFDEDGEENTSPPTDLQLAEYEQIFKSFLHNIDEIIIEIQQSAFEYYKRVYAKYYEQDFEDIFDLYKGTASENDKTHPPLCLDTKEKHFEYMKRIIFINVLDNQTLKIAIRYLLDTEHGMEIKLVNNKVIKIASIDETY